MGVDGVWLQIVLLKALERGALSSDRYFEATADLIEAGIDFTTINDTVLLRIAEAEGWDVSDRLKKALSTIGGEKVDLKSSVQVVSEFLLRLWNHAVAPEKQERLTWASITALTKNHPKATQVMLSALIEVGEQFDSADRKRFLKTIKQWCADNSVVMPTPRRIENVVSRLRAFKSFLMNTTSFFKS